MAKTAQIVVDGWLVGLIKISPKFSMDLRLEIHEPAHRIYISMIRGRNGCALYHSEID